MRKKENIRIVLYFFMIAVVFSVFVFLSESFTYKLGADNEIYQKIFYEKEPILKNFINIKQNYLGPYLIILIARNNIIIQTILNIFIFTLSLYLLHINFVFNKKYYLIFQILNLLIFGSLLTVNKEIIAYLSIILFFCYLHNNKMKYFLLSITISILARWHITLVFLVYRLLILNMDSLIKNRKRVLLVVLISLSILYPLILKDLFSTIINPSTYSSQLLKFGGVLKFLNRLQEEGFFIIVFVPKMLLNLFGNIFRIINIELNNDLYNNVFLLSHQIMMFIVFGLLYLKKKFLFKNHGIYFSIIYLMFFSISYMIQYRYIFPIYPILCLELIGYTYNGDEEVK